MYFFLKTVVLYALIAGIVVLSTIESTAVRDPTSIFFNPKKGYQPRYSQLRRKQAAEFISTHNNTERFGRPETSNTEKKLCVGIPSFERRGSQYVHETIGSLLEGLAAEERDEIFLMVFIPHIDPTNHAFYGETWLHELTDRVLTYDIEDSDKEDVRMMEDEGGVFITKGLYDYSYLLSKCAEQRTPYIAIFEDDTIAMDGWFHRTILAIHEAERQTVIRHSENFLYLRLFYTERFMGWNSEDWAAYVFWSLVVAGIFTAVLFFLWKTKPASKLYGSLGPRSTVLLLYSTLAAAILLFFALGRMTVLPIPAGVREMPRFGCCSQALVFPRSKALELVSYFKDRRTGFMDVLTEDFAEQRDELRFAITPSVVQHVGRESSKRTNQGPIIKKGIWSFRFERYEWEELKREHEAHLKNRWLEDDLKAHL
jgi:hypothetical protein